MVAILTGVRWNLNMVLICISFENSTTTIESSVEAHTCNLSYSKGRDQEDFG
jgi:hypothetical protein